ncbi:mannitol dehydrogenase family protein [Agromyces protaetiae]|uniref:Mannitol-1-phosphate 5-dehydrogenase n=1 Tax=Agromyces protaetiae TaxID=2509455 RepID=A0A4P6FB36_9MICO|nr:mannitol dehydrogenase family protein [Agromyces protaetiae]QAY73450.1 mannitol dehydrogenase family protein [Agromyces protaetiae]
MPPETGHERTTHPPVRLAHLGLGAFHRAHQAWYTHRANLAAAGLNGEAGGSDGGSGAASVGSAAGWGIAAFTGRRPDAAAALAAQDGVYTLVERDADGDRAEVVESIVAAYDGADASHWHAVLADPAVGVLTTTITEGGYRGDAPARIASGLAARRAAGAGPIAIVACDNLRGNGALLRDAVLAAAAEAGPDTSAADSSGRDEGLAPWIAANVSFVDTVVDRITPATTDADRDAVRALTGADDPMAVVAEPFSEWILAGRFPAGRPAWELAGARFVDDLEPYEQRKLWLLNAAHSLLAYAGRPLGFETVDAAFADPALRARVEALWGEQRAVIDLPAREVDDAVAALRRRFANPRIRHSLEQIGRDGTFKLPPRILDPLERRRAAGLPDGVEQLRVLADWAAYVERFGPTDEPSRRLAAETSEASDIIALLSQPTLTPGGTP